jgi:hypothetical protein
MDPSKVESKAECKCTRHHSHSNRAHAPPDYARREILSGDRKRKNRSQTRAQSDSSSTARFTKLLIGNSNQRRGGGPAIAPVAGHQRSIRSLRYGLPLCCIHGQSVRRMGLILRTVHVSRESAAIATVVLLRQVLHLIGIALKWHHRGTHQDLQIYEKTPIVNVPKIKLDPFFHLIDTMSRPGIR